MRISFAQLPGMFALLNLFHFQEAAKGPQLCCPELRRHGEEQSFMHIPDLREQWWKLFVLQAQRKHLL